MSIKLNCLSCGYPMDLGEAYENYQGEFKCWGCRSVLEISLLEGRLQAMNLTVGRPPSQHVDTETPAVPVEFLILAEEREAR
jgi:hypothetical protein